MCFTLLFLLLIADQIINLFSGLIWTYPPNLLKATESVIVFKLQLILMIQNHDDFVYKIKGLGWLCVGIRLKGTLISECRNLLTAKK